MRRSINIVSVCLRFLILLFHCELRSCDGKNITIKFDCSQDGIFYKCSVQNLNLTKSDQNLTILFEQVKSPQEVVIESSTMSFIPPAIFQKFDDLQEFIARNVSIVDIYVETFASARNLHFLILPNNKIEQLVDNIFVNLSHLLSLKLQHNKIKSLSPHAFFGLKELRSLILSSNYISDLPLYIFRDLENLEDLQLDNNFISVLSYNQFERNLGLASLHLENNEISQIDQGTLQNLKMLERVFLRENVCVDKNFAPWRADNQSELNCCTRPFEEVRECINAETGGASSGENFKNHIPLIVLLSLSTFCNFLVVTYFLVYRRKDREVSPDNIELIISDQNGNPYRVY